MRYFALATDYDGTLAEEGVVHSETVAALERFVGSGRRLVMVTGRRLDDMQRVFSRLDLFVRVVAENGAVVYAPETRETRVLEPGPNPAFVDALRARGVPVDVGHVVVATWEPHQQAVLDAIKTLGLELHVEFNKGAVMVLPAGVTKWTGLSAALADLKLSAHNVVAVGDAENDHSFLAACEVAVSVANALPAVRERSDWITPSPRGRGVAELIDRMVADDLKALTPRGENTRLVLGTEPAGNPVLLDPFGTRLLLFGPSGSGKSTIATALVENLVQKGYQVCLVDPEGDYESAAHLTPLGNAENAPALAEIDAVLANPAHSVAATLVAVPLHDRPRWYSSLLGRIHERRATTGRPHWVVVDEAHHVLPVEQDVSSPPLSLTGGATLYVTVDPSSMSGPALQEVNAVVTIAQGGAAALAAFARRTGHEPPEVPPAENGAIFWRVGEPKALVVTIIPPRLEHMRHARKYAHGDLGEDRSFVFRGPNGSLRLKAQNLTLFVQIATGVDDATWEYHLRRGDYSHWMNDAVKDPDLADEVRRIEAQPDTAPNESRAHVREAILKRYTLPA
ncbi:MAG TPA: HAD-IIB family hydrolase [Polyangiaceae bacterium]|nr:HAD-IIB family hydrolase [Polyangiaceae bacterium]